MAIKNTIQLRRGTSADWVSNNTILASGEPAYETDTGRVKIGNSGLAWNNLPYSSIVPTGFIQGTGIKLDLSTNNSSLTVNVSGIPANIVSFDNTINTDPYHGLISTNLQDAIDELEYKKLNIGQLNTNLILFATTANADIAGYTKLVTTTDVADYSSVAIDVSTGTITENDQVVGVLISDDGILQGDIGLINVTTVGNVQKVDGNKNAGFYFKVFIRNSEGFENLIATSTPTPSTESDVYQQFSESAILPANTDIGLTDRIVIRYYAVLTGTGNNPTYNFQFGGDSPVRTLFPVPANVLVNSLWTQKVNNDIYYSDGNVGIGTDNPVVKLHVAGSGKFNDLVVNNTYCNRLYLTGAGENISGSNLNLYQYTDQPTTLLEINQSNLQIIGVSGSLLSSQQPTTYPAISFNKLSNVDFNKTPIKLTSCLTTGGNAGPSWPTVTGISSQAMSSGIFFEDRLWKPSAYDPATGFAYDATSQIVSTPSDTIAGYTKLSFLVQTASGVVDPNNGSVPAGSYVERFSIGSDGVTTVNGMIRAESGEIDSLVVSEGGLNVNGGIIQVNNSFDNNFLMVINSSGISITANYEFIADYIDLETTPTAILDTPSIDATTVKVFFNNQILEVNDTVLFRGITNNVRNGIYVVSAGQNAGTIRFIRHPDYVNGNILNNGDLFGIRYNGSSYMLNPQLTPGENRIIGTNSLSFASYSGKSALTFNAETDAEFTSAIYAKEKYFRIKHPDPDSSYQYLQYGSLESPYHGVRLTGESELKKGVAKIPLPKYLKHLIHKIDINIQLTNNGHHKILYVDSVNLDKDHFIVKGYRSKTGGPFRFYWSFTGVRKDVDPLVPEQ